MDEKYVTEFKWNIAHFQNACYSYKQSCSGTFPLKHNSSAEFALFINSRIVAFTDDEWNSIQFGVVAKGIANGKPVKLRIQLWFEDNAGNKSGYEHTGEWSFEIVGQRCVFEMKNPTEINFMTGKFNTRTSVTLACKLTFVDSELIPKPEHVLSQQLWKVYEQGSDFGATIKFGEKQFKVSYAVLSAYSEVFRNMLTSSFQEGLTKTIEINDFSAPVIEDFVKWMYIGKFEGNDSIDDLFVFADKYAISELKKHCSILMRKSLSESNAAECLVLSSKYKDAELKKGVEKFIWDKGPDFMGKVMSSDAWIDYMNMLRGAGN